MKNQCKSDCGFFGTPATKGYCSGCFKEYGANMYSPVIPRGVSLECAEGDRSASDIEFTHDTALYVGLDIHKRLKAKGDYIKTPAIPLYHSHVLWSYELRLTCLAENKCELSLIAIGPTLQSPKDIDEDSLEINQIGPNVLAASLDIQNKEATSLELGACRMSSLNSDRRFEIDEITKLAGGDVLRVRVRLVIARSYFNLEKLIMRHPKLGCDRDLVETIIDGGKPNGFNYKIIVAESEEGPSRYYVHYKDLASVSNVFKEAYLQGRSHEDKLLAASHDRCVIPGLTAGDMEVVIAIVYGRLAPLPERLERVPVLVKFFMWFFKPEILSTIIFPQWEHFVCDKVDEICKAKAGASCAELGRLLMAVWSCPDGSMPVAKRVAVGAMADRIYLGWRSDEDVAATILKEKAIRLPDELSSMEKEVIIESVAEHINKIASVRKNSTTD